MTHDLKHLDIDKFDQQIKRMTRLNGSKNNKNRNYAEWILPLKNKK